MAGNLVSLILAFVGEVPHSTELAIFVSLFCVNIISVVSTIFHQRFVCSFVAIMTLSSRGNNQGSLLFFVKNHGVLQKCLMPLEECFSSETLLTHSLCLNTKCSFPFFLSAKINLHMDKKRIFMESGTVMSPVHQRYVYNMYVCLSDFDLVLYDSILLIPMETLARLNACNTPICTINSPNID